MVYNVEFIKQIDAEMSIKGTETIRDLCNVDFAETEDVVVLHETLIKKLFEEILSLKSRIDYLEKVSRRK